VAGWSTNHGWNLINLDGECYHLDATCDICEDNDKDNRKYFLVKDKDFTDRQWPKTLYPEAR
jgi:transglutaminase/protease-like cytokinesis protein 3